jgi:hypothetical protein
MAVPESIHEQVAAALKTNLAAITADGTNYNYTPDKVYRVSFFEDRFLDPGYNHIILIRPGDETHEEYATQTAKANAEFFILIAYRFKQSTENPALADTPTRWTNIDRAIRDVLKKLWSDPQLGGLAINVAAETLDVSRDVSVEGWALAELRTVVSYIYTKGLP